MSGKLDGCQYLCMSWQAVLKNRMNFSSSPASSVNNYTLISHAYLKKGK